MVRERDELKSLRYESLKAALCFDKHRPELFKPDFKPDPMRLQVTITVDKAECDGVGGKVEDRRLNRALRIHKHILAHPAMKGAIVQIIFRSIIFVVSFPEGLPAAKFKTAVEALKTALTDAGEPIFDIQLGQSTMVSQGGSSLPPEFIRRNQECKIAKIVPFYLWRHLNCSALQSMESRRSCRSEKCQTSALFSLPRMRDPQVLHPDCSIANYSKDMLCHPTGRALLLQILLLGMLM